MFRQLMAMGPAADIDGRPEPFPLVLTSAAQDVWIRYYDRHRAEQLDLSDDLAAAWSKLEAYTARFALIFQLCRDPDAEAIDERSVAAGITLSEWFGSEARRVYGTFAEDDEAREQRELIEWIRRRGGKVSVRELQQGRRECRSSDDAEALLNGLVQGEHGTWQPVPTTKQGGRPSRIFQLSTLPTKHETPVNPDENEGSVDVDKVDAPNGEVDKWTG